MMTELSLNVLDVANNSISAGASNISILVQVDRNMNQLTIQITDNGCGMDEDQLRQVEDPFYTTRTTRSVGLGVPFFKMAALQTGGTFHIESTPNVGTTVTAVFLLSHIDRMPLGDMNSTIYTLITFNPQINFRYTYRVDKREFVLDTTEFHEILGDIPFDCPEVSTYIRSYLNENQAEVNDGIFL